MKEGNKRRKSRKEGSQGRNEGKKVVKEGRKSRKEGSQGRKEGKKEIKEGRKEGR